MTVRALKKAKCFPQKVFSRGVKSGVEKNNRKKNGLTEDSPLSWVTYAALSKGEFMVHKRFYFLIVRGANDVQY